MASALGLELPGSNKRDASRSFSMTIWKQLAEWGLDRDGTRDLSASLGMTIGEMTVG
jgi:hypothetical protein